MKWILALFFLSALSSVVLFAGISRSTEIIPDPRVRYRNVFGFPRGLTDSFADRLNLVLTMNLLSRFPKDKPYYILDYQPLSDLHRLITQDIAFIKLTDFKTRNQREAIETALKFYRAYIDTFNNTREIRPYLQEFPVPMSQYRMRVCFARDPREELEEFTPYIDEVVVMSFSGSKIRVEQFAGRLCSILQYVDVYDNCLGREPEELKATNPPRLEKVDKDKPIEIPSTTKRCPQCSYFKEEFKFCSQFATKNNLKLIALHGAVPLKPLAEGVIVSSFVYAAQDRFVSLDQAKELVRTICNEHAVEYFKNGTLQYCIDLHRRHGKIELSPKVDVQKHLSFRVSFWDKYIDRVKSPYIAEVRVLREKAQYYVADEYQRLQLIHEEELPPFEVEIPVPKELGSK